ncbi:pyridoxamine 5'-phosphate oxidase family protein [Maritimibacter sp. DP1N21-5]|uniref:pyridoxamine 5'-phosphate oxidase family protein n=1 Tax=Maritimibacter sp. DP1N21-5 TaxID=2836867 RepID=UPI001C48D2E5|nr:pyridoxamine 5'-phosphate oxidase family protein [Maritimibacter sp. DP1N21-5]MBV7409427.1 pyridoxamine 5'-phosphate oxidase family protein [Maritimibacter sp. DP1N21-5]
MAKQFDTIEDAHRRFIEDQHIYFVGTAAESGRVNVSPKGMDSLRILGPNRVLWLNLTGSGNETAAHLARVDRMTLMWCSFTTRPLILRIYGTARTVHPRDPAWDELYASFPPDIGARQIYDVSVEMVQTSCGYAVPFFEAPRQRETLTKWAEDKGEDGIRAYWAEKNQTTIDGFDTGIFDDA